MRQILKELNEETGITGSMVITPDGIMVAAALGPEYEEDVVAAFASSLLLSMKRGMGSLGKTNEMKTCTLNASEGKVVFLDMQNSYLVVVAPPDMKMDTKMQAIDQAMDRIKNRRVA